VRRGIADKVCGWNVGLTAGEREDKNLQGDLGARIGGGGFVLG